MAGDYETWGEKNREVQLINKEIIYFQGELDEGMEWVEMVKKWS